MPRENRSGPAGRGPMTGWGRGSCAFPAAAEQPLAGRGFGRCRSESRGWRNQFYASNLIGWHLTYSVQQDISPKEQSELLKKQAEHLSAELESVRSKLNELEQNKITLNGDKRLSALVPILSH